MKYAGIKQLLKQNYNNFLFIGEAGSGKSEIALNFAIYLQETANKQVHFFDMDMTKPLFRSRDLCRTLEEKGIIFHYEEQFMDAPTLVGGVNRLLKDSDCYVVMDVGGDYIGARAIGGFAPQCNQKNTMVYYVLNAYRPWSESIEQIDRTLGEILGVSHVELEQLHLISNPNIGRDTTVEDVINGNNKMQDLVSAYKPLDFMCVREELFEHIKTKTQVPIMPLHLYLTYQWMQE